MRVLEEREACTTGTTRRAAEMAAEAGESQRQYEQRMHDIRRQLASEADAARSAMEDEERREIAAAREKASAELSALREELRQQTSAAEARLAPEVQTLSRLMIERVVGGSPA
jgi:F0F1-type ATP synthase membrane subunit b/b'